MPRSIVAAATLLGFALASPAASGQTPTLAEPADAGPVVIEPAVEVDLAPPVAAPAPSPAAVYSAPAVACCPISVVKERTTLSAKRLIRCSGPLTNRTVCVANPAGCCGKQYAVPLCVPGCCVGEPRACHARAGLLGRGYVELAWDCGYVARLTFLKRGGVIISYTTG